MLARNYWENSVSTSNKLSFVFDYFNLLELLSVPKNYKIDTKLHPLTYLNVKNLYEPFKKYLRLDIGGRGLRNGGNTKTEWADTILTLKQITN